VELDPEFADALSLLADGYRLLALYGAGRPEAFMTKAKAAAERALEVDPKQAEAYTTLADVAHAHELNYEAAMALWERALQAQPDHVRALGDHGMWGLAILEGKPEAGLAQLRRAIEIDPLSSWTACIHAQTLLFAKRYEEALAEGRRAVELDPGSFLAHWELLGAQLSAGDAAGALATAKRGVETWRHPWYLGRLGIAYAMSGDRTSAEAVYDELVARSKTDFVQRVWIGSVAAALGRMDEAIEMAFESIVDHDPIAIWLMLLPDFEPIRRHVRFPEVVHALKLDEFWRKRGVKPPS
jgi:serine/threonine-protein kinase